MSLVIATPMFGGQCCAEYHRSCLELQRELLHLGMPHEFYTVTNESLITRARNVMAARFLTAPDLSGYEALLFIDADIEFAPADVAALWNLDKPVAGGCYARKAPGEVPRVWVGGEERRLDAFEGPLICDRLATGFLLIRREALQALIERGVTDYDESGQCWQFFNTPVRTWADEHGDWHDRYMLSEDYFFSDAWRAAGKELWTDPEIHLRHWGRAAY